MFQLWGLWLIRGRRFARLQIWWILPHACWVSKALLNFQCSKSAFLFLEKHLWIDIWLFKSLGGVTFRLYGWPRTYSITPLWRWRFKDLRNTTLLLHLMKLKSSTKYQATGWNQSGWITWRNTMQMSLRNYETSQEMTVIVFSYWTVSCIMDSTVSTLWWCLRFLESTY